MYSYPLSPTDGTYLSSSIQHTPLDGTTLKKTKDDILRTMASISKAGGNIEEQVEMLLALPYELDICDYTKAIQSCNDVHLLSLLMYELHNRGLVPDLLLFNVYLKKCEDLEEKEEAFRTYSTLLSDGVVPDKHTMILLIRCCLQSHSPAEAESVLLDAFGRHVEVNSYMYNLLIDYYARRSQPSDAFRLRVQMSYHGIAPDEYTISSLMAACCPQLPSRSHLLILLEDVKTSPLPARSVCASALFSGIAKAPNIENHQKLRIITLFYDALRSRGYVLGQHAYTSLMACCAKLGDVAQAKQFIRDMKASGVEPNQYTLTAFISTCSKGKDYPAALAAFNFMRRASDACGGYATGGGYSTGGGYATGGYATGGAPRTNNASGKGGAAENKTKPNKYTYEAMLVAAGNADRFADAMQIYADMLEEGIRPDASTYARLIIVCGLCQQLQQGVRFVEAFSLTGLPRTSFFYHALIDLYARCHQFARAYAVLNEVRRSPTIEATHHHYEPLIRVLVETRRWEDVDALLAQWAEVSYTTLQFLILNSHKQGDWARVVRYAAMMRQNGQKPYAALVAIIDHAGQQVKMNVQPSQSAKASVQASAQSSAELSVQPSAEFSVQPSAQPSVQASAQSTVQSSAELSVQPSAESPSQTNPHTSSHTPMQSNIQSDMLLAGTPRKAANTMQFLEGKVNSIPEFIPMHLRRTPNPSSFASSLLGAQLPYNALYGGEPLSVEQRALLNDESGFESTLTLEDLDYDLSVDFGLFNDFDFM